MCHAPTHDGVVAIQAHRERLAVKHLLAQVIIYQSAQLVRVRLPMPLLTKSFAQPSNRAGGDFDVRRRILRRTLPFAPRAHPEDECADQDEMQEWFFENGLHGFGALADSVRLGG